MDGVLHVLAFGDTNKEIQEDAFEKAKEFFDNAELAVSDPYCVYEAGKTDSATTQAGNVEGKKYHADVFVTTVANVEKG